MAYPDVFWASSYPLIAQICFYYCNGTTIPESLISDVYREFQKTNFFTSYTIMSEYEDFADSAAAWYITKMEPTYNYQIIGPNGDVLLDLNDQMNAPQSQTKIQWLEKFFARTDLKYKFEPRVSP